jgi:hypothetical protein
MWPIKPQGIAKHNWFAWRIFGRAGKTHHQRALSTHAANALPNGPSQRRI